MGKESKQTPPNQENNSRKMPSDGELLRKIIDTRGKQEKFLREQGPLAWIHYPVTLLINRIGALGPFLGSYDPKLKEGAISQIDYYEDWAKRELIAAKTASETPLPPTDLAYCLAGYYNRFEIFGMFRGLFGVFGLSNGLFGREINLGIKPNPQLASWISYINRTKEPFQLEFEQQLSDLISKSLSQPNIQDTQKGDEQSKKEGEQKDSDQSLEKKQDAIDALVYWLVALNPTRAAQAVAKFGSEEQYSALLRFVYDSEKQALDKLRDDKRPDDADTDVLEQRNKVGQYMNERGIVELIIFHYANSNADIDLTNQLDPRGIKKLTFEQMKIIGSLSPQAASLIYFLNPELIKSLSPKQVAEILLLPNILPDSSPEDQKKKAVDYAYGFLYEYFFASKWTTLFINNSLIALNEALDNNDVYKGKRIIPGPVKDFLKFAVKFGEENGLRIICKLIESMITQALKPSTDLDLRGDKAINHFSNAGKMSHSLFEFLTKRKHSIPAPLYDNLKKTASVFVDRACSLIDQMTRIPPPDAYIYTFSTEELVLKELMRLLDDLLLFFGRDEAAEIRSNKGIPLTSVSKIYKNKINSLQQGSVGTVNVRQVDDRH